MPERRIDGLRVLERFLVDGGPLPDTAMLERTGLAPMAYTRLTADDPSRSQLYEAFTRATARHLATKLAFLPLARAWREAGIDVVVFKGFYLAEFVYEQPAQRHYNDIDVLIRPEAWARAESIAVELGWTIAWRRRESLYRWSHEEAVLTRGTAEVEAHRFVIDCNGSNDALQRRVTAAAWAHSFEVPWEGTSIRALAPADSMLMGLVLARAWSGGDDWHLKTADYPDLRTLATSLGVSREELRRRAAHLGCSRTLELVLRRCDPWRETLDLARPSVWRRHGWYLAVTPERGHLGLERLVGKLKRMPGTIADAVRELPMLLRTWRTLRRGEEPLTDAGDGRARGGAAMPALEAKERIVRGVKWGARLLAFGRDACRLRSRALFAALQATPYPARLYEARGADDARLHAWIEVDGVILRDLHDVRPCRAEEIVACYRSVPTDTRSGSPDP